jgi:hypothetical protein
MFLLVARNLPVIYKIAKAGAEIFLWFQVQGGILPRTAAMCMPLKLFLYWSRMILLHLAARRPSSCFCLPYSAHRVLCCYTYMQSLYMQNTGPKLKFSRTACMETHSKSVKARFNLIQSSKLEVFWIFIHFMQTRHL